MKILAKKSVIKVVGGEGNLIQRFRNRELSRGKAEGTVKSYCFELERLDQWLKKSGSSLERITRFDVQQYVNALRVGKILKNGKKHAKKRMEHRRCGSAQFAGHKSNIALAGGDQ